MTLVAYNNEIPNLIESFLNKDFRQLNTNIKFNNSNTLPRINIIENNESYTIDLAAPGFNKTDFNVQLDNDVLTISLINKDGNQQEEDGTITRREFSYTPFKRAFTLPELVDCDKISAAYINGILKITIPKLEETKPQPIKQIKIS